LRMAEWSDTSLERRPRTSAEPNKGNQREYKDEHETVEIAIKGYMERVKKTPPKLNFKIVGMTLVKQTPVKATDQVVALFRMSSISDGKRFEQLIKLTFTKSQEGFWEGSEPELINP